MSTPAASSTSASNHSSKKEICAELCTCPTIATLHLSTPFTSKHGSQRTITTRTTSNTSTQTVAAGSLVTTTCAQLYSLHPKLKAAASQDKTTLGCFQETTTMATTHGDTFTTSTWQRLETTTEHSQIASCLTPIQMVISAQIFLKALPAARRQAQTEKYTMTLNAQ